MSVNPDYRPLITESVVPQPVNTGYWRTFKVTSKVVLSHVPGLVSAAISGYLLGQALAPSPCSSHHNSHEKGSGKIFLSVIIIGLGVASEYVATVYSSTLIEKHIEENEVNTPEGIQLLEDRLRGSFNPNDFLFFYESKLPALVEMEIFTQNQYEQIKRLSDRYSMLVNTKMALNINFDPVAGSQESEELDVELRDVLAAWQHFKETYSPHLYAR